MFPKEPPMLIQTEPDKYEKLEVLASIAKDDLLSPQVPVDEPRADKTNKRIDPRLMAGVYPAQMPNGKTMSLLRTMFTDHCIMDCQYCPNSIYVPRKRFAFKVDELASLFMEMYNRQTVAGLFLSSGISGSPDSTNEKMVQTIDALRNKYKFKGYVHLKVMPGASRHYVEAASRLGSRLSINIETPTEEMMHRISPHKSLENGILEPMRWINKLIQDKDPYQHDVEAVGQVTQFIVGAADESDHDIFTRVTDLYDNLRLKRAYYMPFFQAQYTPMEEHPETPMRRAGMLYQLDWLKRIYKFSHDELQHAFGGDGNLDMLVTPKVSIAMDNLGMFPVDINTADMHLLLRVPGIGPKSAQRIVDNRRHHAITSWRDMRVLGVVEKQAKPFVVFPGHAPEPAKQAKMELFGEASFERFRDRHPENKPFALSGVEGSSLPHLMGKDRMGYAASGTRAGDRGHAGQRAQMQAKGRFPSPLNSNDPRYYNPSPFDGEGKDGVTKFNRAADSPSAYGNTSHVDGKYSRAAENKAPYTFPVLKAPDKTGTCNTCQGEHGCNGCALAANHRSTVLNRLC